MKTLIALAAASFITTSAMAADGQYPERSNYIAIVPLSDHQNSPDAPQVDTSVTCTLEFIPNDSPDTGNVAIGCIGIDAPSSMFWTALPGMFIIEGDANVPNVEFKVCDAWQSIAVGETVSNPCWMTSTLDTPVRVTREN